jgi:hypothetical protein
MSTCAARRIRIAERVPCRSSHGHAGARPDSRPELNSTSGAFVISHETKQADPTSSRNHLTGTPSCPAAVITPIKSP